MHTKRLCRVDHVFSRAVCRARISEHSVQLASVAIAFARIVARVVGHRMEGVFICLHEVNLVASLTADGVRVAVVVAGEVPALAVTALAKVAILPHADTVGSCDAAAAGVSQRDRERQRAIHETPGGV